MVQISSSCFFFGLVKLLLKVALIDYFIFKTQTTREVYLLFPDQTARALATTRSEREVSSRLAMPVREVFALLFGFNFLFRKRLPVFDFPFEKESKTFLFRKGFLN